MVIMKILNCLGIPFIRGKVDTIVLFQHWDLSNETILTRRSVVEESAWPLKDLERHLGRRRVEGPCLEYALEPCSRF